MVIAGMGQVDVGSTSGNRPNYLNVVANALNYLGQIDICPEARPYVLLMFDVAVLSGLIAQLDAVARSARSYGLDCELEAEGLNQAKELLDQALELIKDRKASLEVAGAITNEVGKLISTLAFEASVCLAMAGVAVVVRTGLEDATG